MKRKPLIVELVGPPGAGKTSLAAVLLKRNSKIRVDLPPDFRRIRHIPFFARSLLLLLPTLLHLYHNREGEWLTPRDMALMTIVREWPRVLERPVSVNKTIVVLEEGAICLLAKLHGFGSSLLRSESAQEWWIHMYQEWAETLDVVIQLDTPISTLVERIRSRKQQYEFQEMSDEEAFKYLTLIQIAQEHVLSALTAGARSPKLLVFNTVEKSSEQICEEVVASGLKHAEAGLSAGVASNSLDMKPV
jgi:adenylate kinase family enzyme